MSSTSARYAHLGPSSSGMFDTEAVLDEIGLHEGDVLLDAGSGEGRFALPAAHKVGAGGRVYAVDIQAERIAALQREARAQGLSNLQVMVADMAQRLPLADRSVDLCLAANVLHEFVENGVAMSVLAEIARVLKAGGRLAVVDFRPELDPPPGPPRSVRLGSGQVEVLVAPHGLTRERSFEVGPYHYGLMFSRQGA